jgi:flagellar biosynthesis protein FlhF
MTDQKGMNTKSYLARSVDEAIAQAREELGAEAMLLNTRRLTGQPGGYEVVFVLPEQPPQPVATEPPPMSPHAVPEDLATELGRLHAQMDEIRSLLTGPDRAQLGAIRTPPELNAVYHCLIASEVDPVLSKEIVDRLGASRAVDEHLQRTGAHRGKLSPKDLDAFEALVRSELERRVGIEPELGQCVALVGPPGAGKTSSIVKLASLVSDLAEARPVRVLSWDSENSLAERCGIAYTKVPAVQMLPDLAAEARKTESLFIDTPGSALADRQGAKAMAAALAACPGIDIHLVVPAYMKPIDLRRCIQRYEIFRPSKLLVTKLDETYSFGSVFSEAARAGLALSFLTHGPGVPRDIRPASPQDLLALALERNPAAVANVA